MVITVLEQKGLRPAFDPERLIERLNPWDDTRKAVADGCRELFPQSFVYVGGHHVAVHNPITGDRMLLLTADSPDFQ